VITNKSYFVFFGVKKFGIPFEIQKRRS